MRDMRVAHVGPRIRECGHPFVTVYYGAPDGIDRFLVRLRNDLTQGKATNAKTNEVIGSAIREAYFTENPEDHGVVPNAVNIPYTDYAYIRTKHNSCEIRNVRFIEYETTAEFTAMLLREKGKSE